MVHVVNMMMVDAMVMVIALAIWIGRVVTFLRMHWKRETQQY
jgi:hypothetical protein